jgi:hypothetical protein
MSSRNPFQRALENLPTYEPSPGLWDRIQRDLAHKEVLQSAIRELPVYEPSPGLWDRIAADLPKAKSRSLSGWWAVAAALLALAVALPLLWPRDKPLETITFETVQQSGWQELQWELPPDDEEAIREVAQRFAQSRIARQSETYHLLQSELNELDAAKRELEGVLNTYGMDPDLIHQLKDIELQRSEVVKRMAAYI